MANRDADGFALPGDFKTQSLDELLKISITLSDSEKLHNAALADSPALAMSEADKQWLIEAMGGGPDGMKSDADRMKESLVTIMDDAETLNHKEYSLDLLLFCVEDIDNANDFVKFDSGTATLLRLLSSETPSLRLGSAWILGTLAQNNPKAQAALHELSTLEPLLRLAHNEAVVDVRRKVLFAISALVRGHDTGRDAFVQMGGFHELARMLSGDDVQLQRRAAFLAAQLLREAPALLDAPVPTPLAASDAEPASELDPTSELDEVGAVAPRASVRVFLVEALVSLVAHDDAELREHVLRLLLLLVAHPTGLSTVAAAEGGEELAPMVLRRKAVIETLEGDEREWSEEEHSLLDGIITALTA